MRIVDSFFVNHFLKPVKLGGRLCKWKTRDVERKSCFIRHYLRKQRDYSKQVDIYPAVFSQDFVTIRHLVRDYSNNVVSQSL